METEQLDQCILYDVKRTGYGDNFIIIWWKCTFLSVFRPAEALLALTARHCFLTSKMPPFPPGDARCRWTTPCRGSPACRRTATKPSACWATARCPQGICWNRPRAGAWAPCSSSTVRNFPARLPEAIRALRRVSWDALGSRSGYSDNVL